MWLCAANLSIGRVPDFMSSERLQRKAGHRPNTFLAHAEQSQIAIARTCQAGNAVNAAPILHFVHITVGRKIITDLSKTTNLNVQMVKSKAAPKGCLCLFRKPCSRFKRAAHPAHSR